MSKALLQINPDLINPYHRYFDTKHTGVSSIRYYVLNMADKIKSFTDLIAWQEAHKLALSIYKTTDVDYLPKQEFFSQAEQTVKVSKLINGLMKSLKA